MPHELKNPVSSSEKEMQTLQKIVLPYSQVKLQSLQIGQMQKNKLYK